MTKEKTIELIQTILDRSFPLEPPSSELYKLRQKILTICVEDKTMGCFVTANKLNMCAMLQTWRNKKNGI